ncbi:MAG: DUF4150 domain-containing protein [Pseudomonadota bacterium]
MVPTVLVNSLTIVHKKSDGVVTCGAPDVCITPNVGPVPYVNVAFSKDLKKGSKTVFADGASIALKDSEFKPSTGDEPGRGGGVASGVTRGWAKFTSYSGDVFIEGRNTARLSDSMSMNGNNPNTFSPAEMQGNFGGPGGILCRIFCWCNEDGNKGSDFVQFGGYNDFI